MNIGKNRINPYPPNLRRMAARIIEPSIGASTWALGSHRWKKNIGIFTRNAIIIIIIMLKLCMDECIIRNEKLFFMKIIPMSRGKEARTVYMRR